MKKNGIRLEKALQNVEELIRFLHSQLGPLETETFLFFQYKDLGSLSLDYEEAKRYRECLRDLTNASVKGHDLSQRRIDTLLQEAILKAFDAVKKRPETALDDRIEEVIKELRRKLLAPPETYRCYIPVLGLSSEALPASFGNVSFIVFDESTADVFRNAISQHEMGRESKEKHFEEFLESDEMIGKICACVEVTTKDAGAARAVAADKLRRVFDALNYFSQVIPNHPRAWAYLGGDAASYRFSGLFLNIDDGGSFYMPRHWVGPLMELSMKRLLESDEQFKLGLSYIDSVLSKPSANKYEKSLLTAIQWAGRAATSLRREETFLLYAIALESVLLTKDEKVSVTYKLRTRIAHLIGGSLEMRRELYSMVGGLYSTRSNIVHNGSYQVPDIELEEIRRIALSCISRLCTDETFWVFTSPQDLADWFNEQVLS